MKSFMKFCLILAAALGVIGIAAVGVGMAMGASPSQFLNLAHYDGSVFHWLSDRVDRAETWSDEVDDSAEQWSEDLDEWSDDWAEDLEQWGEDWGHHWEEWSKGHHGWDGSVDIDPIRVPSDGTADTFETSYEADDVRKIEMDLNVAVLRIVQGQEGSDIRLSGSNGCSYFQSGMDGHTLKIQDTRTYSQYQTDQALELELTVPGKCFDEIELDLGASDVSVERMEAEKLKVDLGAGILAADCLTGAEIEVETGMGSARIERLEASRKADLDVGTGELTVGYCTGDQISLDCGVGTLVVTAAGSETEYNYEVSCGVGTIRIGSSTYSGLDRSQNIDNRAKKKVEADCGIGEISLDFE